MDIFIKKNPDMKHTVKYPEENTLPIIILYDYPHHVQMKLIYTD